MLSLEGSWYEKATNKVSDFGESVVDKTSEVYENAKTSVKEKISAYKEKHLTSLYFPRYYVISSGYDIAGAGANAGVTICGSEIFKVVLFIITLMGLNLF